MKDIRKSLTEKGIKFTPLGEDGVAVDLADLSEEQIKFLKQLRK